MEAKIAKTDKTGWFKRTGWLEHFANRNLAHLAHQARVPDKIELKLRDAAELVELLVEQSVKGLATLPQETRRWLRSARRQEPDRRPIARLQEHTSQARYASYMVRFVCYLLRIVADEEAKAAQDSSSEDSSSDSGSSSSEDDPSDSSQSPQHQRSIRKEKDRMKDARELFQ
jgi:hypothetical protein